MSVQASPRRACLGGYCVTRENCIFHFFLMVTSQILTQPITILNYDKLCQHLDTNMIQYQIFFFVYPNFEMFSFSYFPPKKKWTLLF